jgi:hypothetical protein
VHFRFSNRKRRGGSSADVDNSDALQERQRCLSQGLAENFPNLSQMPICCRATLKFFASAVHEFMKRNFLVIAFRFAPIDQGKHFLWPPETERDSKIAGEAFISVRKSSPGPAQ